MFEGEGDKKKKGVSPLARYVGQEGYTLLIFKSFSDFYLYASVQLGLL